MQFWTTFRRQDGAQPEKDLMLAVLTDAIWDYKRNLAARNARFREANNGYSTEMANHYSRLKQSVKF